MKMDTRIVRRKTPEEEEFDTKLRELAGLESELTQRELDLATMQAELRAFEVRYLRVVGRRYADLDDIEAQIAEALARLNPKNRQAQEQAAQARAQAQDTAQAAAEAQAAGRVQSFEPPDSLRKLYREVAKQVHPDLSPDPTQRERRQRFMAEANRAYEQGDEARLQQILAEWESSPESVKGEGIGAELVRLIRKVAQVKNRLAVIEAEIMQLQGSDLYQLKTKVDEAAGEGRDLLAEMAARLDTDIAGARRRLAAILRARGSDD